MNTYQAVTRTIIMLGTLAVAVMAWQVYGPPPERLAPFVNRAVELAHQSLGRDKTEPISQELAPPQLSAIDDPLALPLPPGTSLRVDSEVAPATYAQESPTSATSPIESTNELLDRVRTLGAVDAELKPWGATGQTYRCQCRVPSVENPVLERHFDAIATDPRAAVEQVLMEIERWRKTPANN